MRGRSAETSNVEKKMESTREAAMGNSVLLELGVGTKKI
jgi:hypothetical protein